MYAHPINTRRSSLIRCWFNAGPASKQFNVSCLPGYSCAAKRQYLFTLQLSRYCCLALQTSIVHIGIASIAHYKHVNSLEHCISCRCTTTMTNIRPDGIQTWCRRVRQLHLEQMGHQGRSCVLYRTYQMKRLLITFLSVITHFCICMLRGSTHYCAIAPRML